MTDTTPTTTEKHRKRGQGKPCAVDGCTRGAYYGTGLCAMHHRRWQRKGIIGGPVPMKQHGVRTDGRPLERSKKTPGQC